MAELGDVAGKTLLHLQCRFGLETLSWARLGAAVTGVDPSPEAIAVARRLAAETGLRATFIESDPSEVAPGLQGEFDIVFASWGAIEQVRDLDRWAQIVAHYLKPGGTFYLAEVHPFAQMLEETADHDVRVDYPYLSGQGQPLPSSPGCPHSFAEILNALIGAGLRIEYLHEFPFSRGAALGVDGARPGRLVPAARPSDDIPFAFSLKATRPAGGA